MSLIEKLITVKNLSFSDDRVRDIIIGFMSYYSTYEEEKYPISIKMSQRLDIDCTVIRGYIENKDQVIKVFLKIGRHVINYCITSCVHEKDIIYILEDDITYRPFWTTKDKIDDDVIFESFLPSSVKSARH